MRIIVFGLLFSVLLAVDANASFRELTFILLATSTELRIAEVSLPFSLFLQADTEARPQLLAKGTAPIVPDPPLTTLPTDTSELARAFGDSAAPNALLYLQGGPVFFLSSGITSSRPLDPFIEETANVAEYLQVYVHQVQTYNPDLKDMGLSFEQCIEQDELSVDILHRVINYYKDMGKRVYVISHSFGSFITPKYLAKYGNAADKIAILSGRLDMPEKVWHGFRDGTPYEFDETDGTTIIPVNVSENDDNDEFHTTSLCLAAGLGMNRYTDLLSDTDLSKVIYGFGTLDESVGRLSAAEESFLRAKGAKVIKIEGGDHGSTHEPSETADILGSTDIFARLVAED